MRWKAICKFLTFYKILKQRSATRHIDLPALLGTGMNSTHTHVANTWLTSFMLVAYVLITLVYNRNTACTGDNSEYEENWWCSCASWWPKQSFKSADLQEKVKTLTKTVELREDRSLMIRPDINISGAISVAHMSSLVYLDPFSRLMDRCYLIWTKAYSKNFV